MKVGLVLPLNSLDGDGATWAGIRDLAVQAEAGGADSLWVFDHFLKRSAGQPELGYHEAWTMLAALAASTRTVGLGTLVTGASFRPAPLVAKMAVTLDEVAGGRLILGLGCGWHEPEYEAFGYPFDHRVSRFDEAIRIIAPLLRGKRVTLDGQWTRLEDAVLIPPPPRSIPVVVAARGERMLQIAARHADGWQAAWFGLPNDRFERDRGRLLEACQAEGRAADGGAAEGRSEPELFIALEAGRPERAKTACLPLDPSAIADALAAWAEKGVAHVQLGVWPATLESHGVALEGIRRFKG